jgi:hypothetical protein
VWISRVVVYDVDDMIPCFFALSRHIGSWMVFACIVGV